LYLREKMEG
jgi:hypothetical protein